MDCSDPTYPKICGTMKWSSALMSYFYFYGPYDGTYPNSDSIGCRDCEPGFYCYFGIKEDCPPGTWCYRSQIVNPPLCPAGSYCEGGSQTYPLKCPAKTYSEVGWSECKSCPAGFFCDGGIKQNCPKGTDLKFSDTIFYFRFKVFKLKISILGYLIV